MRVKRKMVRGGFSSGEVGLLYTLHDQQKPRIDANNVIPTLLSPHGPHVYPLSPAYMNPRNCSPHLSLNRWAAHAAVHCFHMGSHIIH